MLQPIWHFAVGHLRASIRAELDAPIVSVAATAPANRGVNQKNQVDISPRGHIWTRNLIEEGVLAMAKQKVDFRHLDVSELMDARNEIEHVLSEKVAEERRLLEARLDALAAFLPRGQVASVRRGRGRRPAAVNGARKVHPLKGRKAPIKYRGPNGEAWSGRGLAPRWLSALEQKGKKRGSFLVAKN